MKKKKLINNTGLNWTRECQEISEKDWLGGKITGIADNIPDYKKYLPQGERQNIGEEKMDCVARSANNILETQFNYLIQNRKLSNDNLNWLVDNGYAKDSADVWQGIEFSDAFVAINGGTTRQGNSLKSACEAVRKYGLIPKSMLPQVDSFDEYHNPARITQEMRDLGQKFLRSFSINYYKVYPHEYDKKIIHTGLHAWGKIKNGVYQRIEYSFNHSCMVAHVKTAFDNYMDSVDGDFIKDLSTDYKLLPHSYVIVLDEKPKSATMGVSYKKDWRRILQIFKTFFQCKTSTR